MFNRVILIGNLTKDPEVRYTPGGTPVATIPIAVNSKYKSGEDWKEEVLFINVVIFGKQAEARGQYLTKGKSVLVEGRLVEKRWEHEGQKKSRMEITAQTVRFLSKKDTATSTNGAVGVPDEISDVEPF